MKKIIHSLTAFVGILCMSTMAFGQAAQQGNVIIDPYYGFPNFGKSLLSTFENATEIDVKGIGPAGLRVEYMLSNKIGLGIDAIYNSNIVSGNVTSTDSVYNGTTDTWDYTSYTTLDRRSMQRIRIQARMNFHFTIDNPNLDAYFGVGAGTNNRIRSYTRNGVEQIDNADLGNITLLPFSMRLCTGARYYFTENIGANMEIGLGGPVISAGLSLKF